MTYRASLFFVAGAVLPAHRFEIVVTTFQGRYFGSVCGQVSIDDADLEAIVLDMARSFRGIMETVSASRISLAPNRAEPDVLLERSFAELFEELIRQFADARKTPFHEIRSLWATMAALQSRMENLPSVRQRPHIITKWSLGKGNWANVPWIALLNRDMTTSTNQVFTSSS